MYCCKFDPIFQNLDLLNTVDFVMGDGTIVLRTCAEERDKVVFQIGTADAKRALKVAKMV